MPPLTKGQILSRLAADRTDFEKRFSVRRIGLFGSFARGAARPDSDVDILVELSEPTFDHYMDLKFALEDAFGRPVDLVLAETLKPALRSAVERDLVNA